MLFEPLSRQLPSASLSGGFCLFRIYLIRLSSICIQNILILNSILLSSLADCDRGGHTILTVEQMRGWKMAATSMNELTVVSPVQGEVTGSLSPVLTPKCDWRHRLSLRSHRQPRNGPAGEVSNWTDWDNEYLNNILTCGNCINYSL